MLDMRNYVTKEAKGNKIIVNGAIFEVGDNVAEQIMELILAKVSTPKVATPKKTPKKRSKKFSPAKDFRVPYEVRKAETGYVLGFTENVPRDAYKVVANLVEAETGKKYDKNLKGFAFKLKKDAESFLKAHPIISGCDRDKIRESWNK